jgi:DNA polymerase-3 subunit delta
MQIRLDPKKPELLTSQLTSKFSSPDAVPGSWAITGDDPLLTTEAADLVRAFLRQQGFDERLSDTTDRSFDWRGWLADANAPSLFANRRILELRLPTGKPGTEGNKALSAWAQSPAPDTAVVLLLPRADRTMIATGWFTAFTSHGLVITVPELQISDLPGWIAARLAKAGLTADPQAIAVLATKSEGNLAAAHQEILKLAYLPRKNPQAPISAAEMQEAVTDAARFSPFQLGDAFLAGDAKRSLRMLRGLREEGEALPLLIWSVSNSVRRLPVERATDALRELGRIDTMAKGLLAEDPWMALERLALSLSRSR